MDLRPGGVYDARADGVTICGLQWGRMRPFRTTLFVGIVALLAAPAVALACSRAAEPVSPHISIADLRFAHHHRGNRAAWVRHESWASIRIHMAQHVQLRGMRQMVPAAYAQQRSVRIMVIRPGAGRYTEDPDPATTCALAGQQVWSTPRILLRETPRAIFMTAITRKTTGSTAGCGVVAGSCDDLTFRTIALDAPIGDRRIYSATFT